MSISFKRTSVALAILAAVSVAGTAFGQAAPLGGTITLGLVPSTLAPLPGTTFTVDLIVDLTNATGTCTGATVPMTLGAYNLGITYDSTKLTYNSRTSCGVAEFTNPVCVNHPSDPVPYVNCNDANADNTSSPTGSICVARLTFTNVAATLASPASLATLHDPSPRGVSSNLILTCSPTGPATFPPASIVDALVPTITPASLVLFDAE